MPSAEKSPDSESEMPILIGAVVLGAVVAAAAVGAVVAAAVVGAVVAGAVVGAVVAAAVVGAVVAGTVVGAKAVGAAVAAGEQAPTHKPNTMPSVVSRAVAFIDAPPWTCEYGKWLTARASR
jgi:hypothetical protein